MLKPLDPSQVFEFKHYAGDEPGISRLVRARCRLCKKVRDFPDQIAASNAAWNHVMRRHNHIAVNRLKVSP